MREDRGAGGMGKMKGLNWSNGADPSNPGFVADSRMALKRMQDRRNAHCPSGWGLSYQALIFKGVISER